MDKPGQGSWYEASARARPDRPAQSGEVRADVCVIGGGFTGLSAALELARGGRRVVLLEAERVGFGASGRNGGQVIFGYSCDQSKIEAELGLADSKQLFDWAVEAVELIHQRRAEFKIDCDWRDGHLHAAIHQRHWRELQVWQDDLSTRYGYDGLQLWDRERLRQDCASERYLGGLFDPRSGHLHPLNYSLGLADAAERLGASLHEHSRVLRIEHGPRKRVHTAQGVVDCEFLVLGANAFVGALAPTLDARIMPVGTYVGATRPLGEARARELIRNDIAIADMNWALDYFRFSADHRLLFGGRASYSTLQPPNLRWVMKRRMQRVFPSLQGEDFDYLWGGLIDISLSRAPHWGRLDPRSYFAQGFSGHGVATAGLAGKVIAEAILGQSSRLDVYEKLKHRPFPGGRLLRTPLLVAAMGWYKLRDALW